ncbi:ATP-dependent DNA helicase [Cohnella terricola]|uniref:ATP-dependent DNA helicase n=1 Tax=Cohnella terricola TaxID=1289167 RepID=UPI00319EA968
MAKAINKWFIELRKKSGGQPIIMHDAPSELLELAEALATLAEKELAGNGKGAESANLLEAYFAVAGFLRIGKLYDERYVTYVEVERNEVRLKMFCLDPSHLLKQIGKAYRSHVFFSATLSPLNYFMDMLGSEEEDYSIKLGSPFRKEQWDVTIVPLSTRYTDRERTKERLIGELLSFIRKRPGNYLIFFPSYEYMNDIYQGVVATTGESIKTLLQTPDMTEEEREGFLAAFDAGNEGTLAGFAVMGGIFSEGVDLVGNRLGGVAVIGVGMPQIGLERNLIKNHFGESGRVGFDYAYVYPGINKVLQAGGRLIRSEHDCGSLMLVDDRYTQLKYARLLPEEWRE